MPDATPGARRTRFVRALLACLLVLAVAAPAAPVAAWGGGEWYGTHDWVIDGALEVLDGRVDEWFNAQVARDASDDPDTQVSAATQAFEASHIYRNIGVRGGGVNAVATEFYLAQAAYAAGAVARDGSDAATARAKFDEASYHIGLLSHYLSDLGQPFHASHDGIGKDTVHRAYEGLVNKQTKTASSRSDWVATRRTVKDVVNIRTTTIGTAAYSRSWFPALWSELRAHGVTLTSRVAQVTANVLKRVTGDLADIIWSVERGTGAAPSLGSLRVSVRYVGVRASTTQTINVTALDTRGRPIEGLRVAITWPTATGTRTFLLFTDAAGKQHAYGSVGTSPRLTVRPIVATAIVNGVTRSASSRWVISPRLPAGTAGFRTTLNDTYVTAGQTVHVVSLVRDAIGRGLPNLTVTWSWNYAGTIVRTRGIADATGRARSSQAITTTTPLTPIRVTATVQSGSVTYTSGTSFRRAP